MSNIIPPMVSSSPPPMDDTMEEDEDDEFGDFAAAEDDGPSTPAKLPSMTNTFWENGCEIKHSGMCNGSAMDEDEEECKRKEVERQDNTSQDSVVSGTTDSGLCSASQNSGGASPSPVAVSPGPDREESSASDETLVRSVDLDAKACSDVQTESIAAEEVVASSDDFENFSDFQSVSEVVRTESESEVRKHLPDEVDEFGEFEGIPIAQDDNYSIPAGENRNFECVPDAQKNDFGNFECVSAKEENYFENFKSVSTAEESDFGNFEDVSATDKSEFGNFKSISATEESNLKNFECVPDAVENDFGNFECVPTMQSSNFGVFESDQANQDSDFGEFEYGSSAQKNDFGEFECVSAAHKSDSLKLECVSAAQDDDFEDFESTFTSYSVPVDQGDLVHRLQAVVTSLFPPGAASLLDVNVSALDDSLTTLWLKLKDIESSHALSYQWSGSTANKSLLSALGIDSRNILFGARWNTSVPRFAANLGFSPLEPVRASRSSTIVEPVPLPPPQPAAQPAVEQEAAVPAAQFDWNSSGLVNPLDSAEEASNNALVPGILARPEMSSSNELMQQILASNQSTPAQRSRQGLSTEAVKVLDELPDLSFLQAKLLMFPVRGTSP